MKTLKDIIALAFEGSSLSPEDETIWPYDEDDFDSKEIASYFKGRNWKSIAPHDLIYYQGALFWFTEAAFVYFLPSFLLACLEDDIFEFLVEPILFNLTPDASGDASKFLQRVNRLNGDQFQAIQTFLLFVRSEFDKNEDGYHWMASKDAESLCSFWRLDNPSCYLRML